MPLFLPVFTDNCQSSSAVQCHADQEFSILYWQREDCKFFFFFLPISAMFFSANSANCAEKTFITLDMIHKKRSQNHS